MGNALSIVMKPDVEIPFTDILGYMNKTGITVFQDIVNQFLGYSE